MSNRLPRLPIAVISCWVVSLGLGIAAAISTDWARPTGSVRVSLDPALPLDRVVSDPERYAGRRVVARGRYDLEHSVFVLGSTFEGRRGASVFTPFRIAEAGDDLVVLVERGWIPKAEVELFSELDRASEEREIYARVRPQVFGPAPPEAKAPPRRVWRRFHPRALQKELPYPLLPMVLAREAGSGIELPVVAPLAAIGAGPGPPRAIPLGLWAAALGCAGVGWVLRRRS